MLLFVLILIPYSVLVLNAYIHMLRHHRIIESEVTLPDILPELTVIVAAKDEEVHLPFLISDLQRIDYPADKLEIFIVDNNSSDQTAEIIKKADKINYLLSDTGGKKQAIAMALKHSSGDYVISTDADCRIKPGWIKACVSEFINSKADLIIGQVDPDTTNGILSGPVQLEFFSLQAITAGLALAGRPVMCNGANLAYRKSLAADYTEAVKSSIQSGDDMFLLHHAKQEGKKIIWLSDNRASVISKLPGDIYGYFRQRTRWASKSLKYSDRDTIFTGLSTILANLGIVTAIIVSFFDPAVWILAIILISVKLIPDILILSAYLKLKRRRLLLIWFLPLSILYPFYAILTLLASPFRDPGW